MKPVFRRIISLFICSALTFALIPVQAAAISVPDEMKFIHGVETVLAPGIIQNKSSAFKSNGERINIFTAEIDTTEETVQIAANYKDNQCDTRGLQVLTKQVAAAEKNHRQPFRIMASINGSFYDPDGTTRSPFIMNGKTVEQSSLRSFFAILKDGTPFIGYPYEFSDVKDNIQHAVAGHQMLVYNGEVLYKNPYTGVYPSTVIGITNENKVVFMVVDGRQAPESVGLSEYEMAQMIYSLGCSYAIMLDGGGSATFGSREPWEENFTIKNSPSDGGERAVANSLYVASTAPEIGTFDHAALRSDYNMLTGGTSLEITPFGLDSSERSAPLPETGLSWKISDSSMGTITQDGIFTASEGAEGNVTVTLEHNGVDAGSIELTVTVPDTIKFGKKKVNAFYNERLLLPVVGSYMGIPVAINENDFIAVNQYEFDGSVPDEEFEDYGYFDGLYFITPDESMGLKSEILYMISAYSESDDDIYRLTVEYHDENDSYFDFDNATFRDDKIAYYRTLTNTETQDNYNYTVIEPGRQVDAEYKFGIALNEMEIPEEMKPMWESLAPMLGDSVWDAYLKIATKVDPESCVTVKFTLDENLNFKDIFNTAIESELFKLEQKDITYDPATNTAQFVFYWDKESVMELVNSQEGLTSDTVSSTVIFDGFKTALKESADFGDRGIINISNNLSISYNLILTSNSAYKIASENEDLAPYAFENGNKRGIMFSTEYENCDENYNIFAAESSDGWQNNRYIIDGEAVTGIALLPSAEGDGEFYFSFDDDGECLGKYTGIITENGAVRYAENGSLSFAGIVKDNGDYYYIGESGEAVFGENIFISQQKTNGFADEGYYSSLGDFRLILGVSDEGIIDYEEYIVLADDDLSAKDNMVSTGHIYKKYSDGILVERTVVKYGDIDSDGRIDARDAVILSCYTNGMIELSFAQSAAADYSKNNTTDDEDYSLMISGGLMM